MQLNIDIHNCAFAELTGFNSFQDYDKWEGAHDAVKLVAREADYDTDQPDASMILMSYAWDVPARSEHREKAYGKKRMDSLLKYIKQNKLGRVTAVPQHVNPNHDSFVKAYVWSISRRRMDQWVNTHGLRRHNRAMWEMI